MRHIIVYDISDTKIRNKVSRVLEGLGQRVQRSVFECNIAAEETRGLAKKLERLMGDVEGDSVRIYPVCRRCWGMALGVGQFKEDDGSSCTILD